MIPTSRTNLPVLRPFRLGAASSVTSILPLNGRQGVILVAALLVSAGIGEANAGPAAPSILATIVKWTPLLAQGFALNIAMSFLAMAIGMSAGTRFYTLAAVATVVICGVVIIMDRFDWFKLDVQSQLVKVQVPPDTDYTSLLDDVFVRLASRHDLVSAESIRGGALVELLYSVKLKSDTRPTVLLTALQERTGGQKVSVLTGYDRTDL